MKYKKSMIIIMLAIFIFSIAAVSASDVNDTVIASEDTGQMELSASDEITGDNLQTNENNILTQSNDEETVSAETDSEILSDGEGTYYDLINEIDSGGNINLTKNYYRYTGGNAIEITKSGVINGKGAVIDMAGSTIRAFNVSVSGVIIKNLTIKNANFDGNGGAIYFSSSGTVENCNFTNNKATGDDSYGGAIEFDGNGTVTNCNFIGNNATCYGGAIYFSSSGTTHEVINCNFVNNSASEWGGAVYFQDTGEVTNCNFTNNSALYGGAIEFDGNGTVTNCNFTNNKATGVDNHGGAVCFWDTGEVTNCNFVNNSASNRGGAVYFWGTGEVTNCSFTNNSALYGGAIEFDDNGTVTNCNFTGNNATTGSAIYFGGTLYTKSVSNSCFLNNRANAETLEVTKNDNNITIVFTGNDNLLNAIYSNGDVTFTNVTYWGANGIANTGSSSPVRSSREAGQNITVSVVVNDELVLNKVITTDENGMIVLDISAGENYYISVRHETDSYYTEAETINSTMKFNVNVTSQTTNNKTVNITAKSNIPNEVIDGKLLFIVQNSDSLTATYAGNGTWWAVYTFDDYAVYEVNATFEGLDNVTVNNRTITITKADSTLTVGDVEFDYNSSGSTTVIFDGATGVNASVIGQPNANVNVAGNAITVSGLNAGTYTLSVTTIADADHNNVTKTSTITVNKLKTELTASDITTTYKINKDLVITLKDSTGKALSGVKVSVDLNGAKEYTTDSNGQVKVSTKGLAPKTYTVKIAFNGNTNYDKSVKEVKVTVKKATPKLTAKKKTFKATTKTKKYTITLKDNTGKAIKKAKVTLKVKGKTYKATTNSKGKATFKITKLNKKGTYKAKITYKGNKYYKKANKKVKIKVIVAFKTASK